MSNCPRHIHSFPGTSVLFLYQPLLPFLSINRLLRSPVLSPDPRLVLHPFDLPGQPRSKPPGTFHPVPQTQNRTIVIRRHLSKTRPYPTFTLKSFNTTTVHVSPVPSLPLPSPSDFYPPSTSSTSLSGAYSTFPDPLPSLSVISLRIVVSFMSPDH